MNHSLQTQESLMEVDLPFGLTSISYRIPTPQCLTLQPNHRSENLAKQEASDPLDYFSYVGLEQSESFYKIFMLDPDQLDSEPLDLSPMDDSLMTSTILSESTLDQCSPFESSEDTENSQVLLT